MRVPWMQEQPNDKLHYTESQYKSQIRQKGIIRGKWNQLHGKHKITFD